MEQKRSFEILGRAQSHIFAASRRHRKASITLQDYSNYAQSVAPTLVIFYRMEFWKRRDCARAKPTSLLLIRWHSYVRRGGVGEFGRSAGEENSEVGSLKGYWPNSKASGSTLQLGRHRVAINNIENSYLAKWFDKLDRAAA